MLLLSPVAFADKHTWVGGSHDGGGWGNPLNWKNEANENEVPVAGDTAVFSQWNETVVANDDDAALFCSLELVRLESWSYNYKRGAEVVLDVSTNVLVGCAINGTGGRFIKRGVGTAELASEWTDSSYYAYSRYRTYDFTVGGTSVEAGTLVLPQDRSIKYIWNYAPINIEKGATLVCSKESDNACYLYQLTGEGVFTNRNDTEVNLQIGRGSVDQPTMAEFKGKLTGKFKILVYGSQALTGAENDFTAELMAYTGNGKIPQRGTVAVAHMGMKGRPSSIGTKDWMGLFYCGNFMYVGEGETTDKSIYIDSRPNSAVMTPVFLDGGPNGGLTINGSVMWSSYGQYPADRWLTQVVLSGSNAAPCTIAGPYKMQFMIGDATTGIGDLNYSYYTIKSGSGTWRFNQNASTTYRGAFDVREGTLQFDSLTPRGSLCALGFGDLPTDGVISKWDADRFCDIAFRFGGTNSAAIPVFEYVGSGTALSLDRKAVLNNDVHIRASGASAMAALTFGGIQAVSNDVAKKTLTLDGANAGANTFADFTEEEGACTSLVKDGSGTWYLEGDQAFSGDLTVKSGTLVVGKPVATHRYFKIVFTDGYGNPNGSYINEFALYDKDGNRVNKGLVYRKPDNVDWSKTYYPHEVASTLDVGEMANDSYGTRDQAAYTYGTAAAPKLNDLTDGSGDTAAQFLSGFGTGGGVNVGVVSMRLADDAPEVAYMDFSQNGGRYPTTEEYVGKYQTASAFELYGSVNGIDWRLLVATNGLPWKSAGRWYFSKANDLVSSKPDARDVVGDGVLALDARAADVPEAVDMAGYQFVEVAAGATLAYAGEGRKTISRLRIDASTGAGTIRGFDFADVVEIDIVNPPKRGGTVAVDFADIGNFDQAVKTFTVDGEASRKFTFKLAKDGLTTYPSGLMLILR